VLDSTHRRTIDAQSALKTSRFRRSLSHRATHQLVVRAIGGHFCTTGSDRISRERAADRQRPRASAVVATASRAFLAFFDPMREDSMREVAKSSSMTQL
jgi:hypothetical protein